MIWRHITFAVDPAGHIGQQVAQKLASLASAFHAEIELFYTAFEWSAFGAGGMGSVKSDQEVSELLGSRQHELESVAESLRDQGVRARAIVSCVHSRDEGILRHIAESGTDLLVTTFNHRDRLTRSLINCPCPVWLMQAGGSFGKDSSVLAAVDPAHIHGKPAALDEAILEAARVLAKAFDASLRICHASAPWPKALDYAMSSGALAESAYEKLAQNYEDKSATRVKEIAELAHVPQSQVVVACGNPEDVLPRCARMVGAAVVVLGAVPRAGMDRLLIGQTAERVLDALDCDVLIVKPPLQ